MPGFGAKISEVAPDVVGLQECQDANALAGAAPGYTVLGGTGPQNYILYDASRLEALESGWMDVPRDCYAQRTDLDKIFATSEWTKIDAGDRGTGGSDHPAISASLRL